MFTIIGKVAIVAILAFILHVSQKDNSYYE